MMQNNVRGNCLTKEWIVNFILTDGANTDIPQIVKVLKHLRGPNKDGSVERQISDGNVFIKAVFTSESSAKFILEQNELSPPELNKAILLLKKYELHFEPHLQQDQCEFFIVVNEFVLWSAHQAFDPKNTIENCMYNPSVRSCAVAAWNVWKETEHGAMDANSMSLSSVSLSQLLEAISNQSGATQELALPPTASKQSTSKLQEHWSVVMERNLCVEDFIIPDHEMAILNSIEEWKEDYRPPASLRSTESSEPSPAGIFPGPTLVDIPIRPQIPPIPNIPEKMVIYADVHRQDENSDSAGDGDKQEISNCSQESIHFTCSISSSVIVTTSPTQVSSTASDNAVTMVDVGEGSKCSTVCQVSTNLDTSQTTESNSKTSVLQISQRPVAGVREKGDSIVSHGSKADSSCRPETKSKNAQLQIGHIHGSAVCQKSDAIVSQGPKVPDTSCRLESKSKDSDLQIGDVSVSGDSVTDHVILVEAKSKAKNSHSPKSKDSELDSSVRSVINVTSSTEDSLPDSLPEAVSCVKKSVSEKCNIVDLMSSSPPDQNNNPQPAENIEVTRPTELVDLTVDLSENSGVEIISSPKENVKFSGSNLISGSGVRIVSPSKESVKISLQVSESVEDKNVSNVTEKSRCQTPELIISQSTKLGLAQTQISGSSQGSGASGQQPSLPSVSESSHLIEGTEPFEPQCTVSSVSVGTQPSVAEGTAPFEPVCTDPNGSQGTQAFVPHFNETEPFVPHLSETLELQSTEPFIPQFSENLDSQSSKPFEPQLIPTAVPERPQVSQLQGNHPSVPDTESVKRHSMQTSVVHIGGHPFVSHIECVESQSVQGSVDQSLIQSCDQNVVSHSADSENNSSEEICSLSLLSKKNTDLVSYESTQKEDNCVRPDFQLSPIISQKNSSGVERCIVNRRSHVDRNLDFSSGDISIMVDSVVEADVEESRRLSLLAAPTGVRRSGSHTTIRESDDIQLINSSDSSLDSQRQEENDSASTPHKKSFRTLKRKWDDSNNEKAERGVTEETKRDCYLRDIVKSFMNKDLSDREYQQNMDIAANNLSDFQLDADTVDRITKLFGKKREQEARSILHSMVSKTNQLSQDYSHSKRSTLCEKRQNGKEVERECELPTSTQRQPFKPTRIQNQKAAKPRVSGNGGNETSTSRNNQRRLSSSANCYSDLEPFLSVKPVISHTDYLEMLAQKRKMKSQHQQCRRIRDDDHNDDDDDDHMCSSSRPDPESRSHDRVEETHVLQVVSDVICTESKLLDFRLSPLSLMKIKKLFQKTKT